MAVLTIKHMAAPADHPLVARPAALLAAELV